MFRAIIWMLLCATSVCAAGEFNQVLNVGDAAPAWTDLQGTDGKTHSLADLKDSDVVVVAFFCNSCPYANDAEQRINAITKDYRDLSVSVVAINVNKVDADLPPAMQQRAEKQSYAFAYLYDESQQIARDFGAMTTPEFYVLGKDRKVVYMGSLDDSPDGSAVTKRYVRLGIDAALSNSEPKVAETVPIGCRIRYERQRRSRRREP